MTIVTPLAPYIGERVPKILAVDDEESNIRLLKNLLMAWHCDVRTAAKGAEALKIAKTFAPDAILLDVRMPGQSGFEVCAALQADPRTRRIPVIFLTAAKTDEDMVRGLETGARAYLTKPFDFADLAATLGVWLRQKYVDDAATHSSPSETSSSRAKRKAV